MIAERTKETVSKERAGTISPRRGKETIHHSWPVVRQVSHKVAEIKLTTAVVRRDTSVLNVLTRKQSRRKIGLLARPD